MVQVRLYGKLRRLAENQAPDSESVAWVPWQSGETVAMLLKRIGIDPAREVSNIFINGRYFYSVRQMCANDGDRLGVFPKNMALLYC